MASKHGVQLNDVGAITIVHIFNKAVVIITCSVVESHLLVQAAMTFDLD